MAWQSRKPLHEKSSSQATTRNRHHARPLRFEPLEDRRMLAAIPGIDDTFVQVSRITNAEVTVLSADAAGHFKIYYHPNDELGYIDPATGDLITADYVPSTSGVLVLTAIPSGNFSNLVGVTYSNGQVIATNGGNTVYHYDGSIMRQGNVWTYDAGAPLENASGNWFWSNGNQLRTGSTMYHANGAVLRNAAGSLFYAGGATFQDAATSSLFYVGGQTLRNASSDYFYASGTALKTGSPNTIRYSNNVVMVDSTGNVYNATGTLAFAPFTNTQTIGASEYYTHVDDKQSDTVFSTENDVSGEFGAYVSTFHITFQVLPPNPLNIAVAAPDATSLRFTWNSGGGTTAGYRVAITNGASPPSDPATGVDTANNYFEVTGLTAGQKVSIRVWAKDSGGLLSSGVFASGTAGLFQQATQTGWLIASSLDTTFAQVYDDPDRNTIFTIDRVGNFIVAYYVNDDLGYVNIANGDRLHGAFYEVPGTDLTAPELADVEVLGNISSIPDGARYPNGTTVRSGNTYYYSTGATLRSADGTWFYQNGLVLQNATTRYWPGNIIMQQGNLAKYPNGATLRSSAGNISYQSGALFFVFTSTYYPNGSFLKNTSGDLFYESGASLYSNGIFRYETGTTMIDTSGVPYDFFGTTASVPFQQFESLASSNAYVGVNNDRIAHYAVAVQTNNAVHVLGDTVDYAARNGDFNRDGSAGAADYVLWRKTANSTFNLAADANANGTIDQPDYDTWRAHFGQTLPALGVGSGADLVEPPAEPGAASLTLVSAPTTDSTTQPPALPGVSPSAENPVRPALLLSALVDGSPAVSERLPHVAAPLRDANRATNISDDALLAWLDSDSKTSNRKTTFSDDHANVLSQAEEHAPDNAFDSLDADFAIIQVR